MFQRLKQLKQQLYGLGCKTIIIELRGRGYTDACMPAPTRLRACAPAHTLDVRMYIIMSRLEKSGLKCF